jgi:hypothetical protein
MKKLILALTCVLLMAGFAVAADIDFKGMYYARGSYIDNDDGLSPNDTANYFYFDHELDITTRILVTDKTRVIVNFEIHDENWLQGNTDGRDPNVGPAADDHRDYDDNIEFKRVFSSHTFDYGGVLDLGLMTGGAWMTGFGDNGNGRYRVKYTQPTQLGPVIAIYEKNAELGSTNADLKKSEKDDATAYYLASVMKFGDFNVYPLLGYVDNSADIIDQKTNGQQTFLFLLGTDATFGDFGFEAEFNYLDTNQDKKDNPQAGLADDFSRWGIYGNGWWNVGAGKVGLLASYGSWDNDNGMGFDMGADFTPTLFGADWAAIGGGANNNGYAAVSMIQLYGSLAISEQFSINGSALYWGSTSDEQVNGQDDFWKDADGYEIDAGLDYKITDAVTYTVAAAFGKISLDNPGKTDNGGNPDGFVRAYHRFRISF